MQLVALEQMFARVQQKDDLRSKTQDAVTRPTTSLPAAKSLFLLPNLEIYHTIYSTPLTDCDYCTLIARRQGRGSEMLGMPPRWEAGQSGRNQMQWLPWKYGTYP